MKQSEFIRKYESFYRPVNKTFGESRDEMQSDLNELLKERSKKAFEAGERSNDLGNMTFNEWYDIFKEQI